MFRYLRVRLEPGECETESNNLIIETMETQDAQEKCIMGMALLSYS